MSSLCLWIVLIAMDSLLEGNNGRHLLFLSFFERYLYIYIYMGIICIIVFWNSVLVYVTLLINYFFSCDMKACKLISLSYNQYREHIWKQNNRIQYKEKVNIWSKGRVGKNINYETNFQRDDVEISKRKMIELCHISFIYKRYTYLYMYIYILCLKHLDR